MTTQIKCANCPTTVQRVFGPDDDASAPWLCPECDTDEGDVPIEDESEIFGSEEQLRKADSFNGESTNIPYVEHAKREDLWGDDFPDDTRAKRVLDKPGGWFADSSIIGPPTLAQRKKTEQRLVKHSLAENQLHSQEDIQGVVEPALESSEFQGDIQHHQFERGLGRKSWHAKARRRANGSDLNGYHAVRTREHQRLIPAWTLRDDQVREVLDRLFPEHDTDARQRESAGRWLRIIYLFFRVHQWDKTIAGAVGSSVRAVEGVIRRARAVGEEMFGSASSAVDAYEEDQARRARMVGSEMSRRAGSDVDALEGDYACCPELKAA